MHFIYLFSYSSGLHFTHIEQLKTVKTSQLSICNNFFLPNHQKGDSPPPPRLGRFDFLKLCLIFAFKKIWKKYQIFKIKTVWMQRNLFYIVKMAK